VSYVVVLVRHMGRASEIQKNQRLNHARELRQRFAHLPNAVSRMAKGSGISPRQAYRYLQQAQRLKQPLPIGDAKIAFGSLLLLFRWLSAGVPLKSNGQCSWRCCKKHA
jgi:hypothetical protein